MQPLTIGETRNVTAVIKGEAKAVTLQLVDAQNKRAHF